MYTTLPIILTIHVTETTGFTLLGMMEPTGPVHSYVALVAVKTRGTFHAASSANTAKLEQTIEHRTVITDVIPALFLRKLFHVVRSNL